MKTKTVDRLSARQPTAQKNLKKIAATSKKGAKTVKRTARRMTA